MRSWRNWQTRKTKDLVGNSMQVQFLSTAPNKWAPLVGAFWFGMTPAIRRELRVGAVCESKRFALESRITISLTAKAAIHNCRAGRAAKGAIPGRSFLAIPSLCSLRPHQNRVIMQNKCINARFFCVFDRFMRSKKRFFAIYPYFWHPFWRPHFNILFPL